MALVARSKSEKFFADFRAISDARLRAIEAGLRSSKGVLRETALEAMSLGEKKSTHSKDSERGKAIGVVCGGLNRGGEVAL